MLENGDNVEIIHLDFIKAYDQVDHFILIEKLKAMGITGKNISLIEHWLIERKQCT